MEEISKVLQSNPALLDLFSTAVICDEEQIKTATIVLNKLKRKNDVEHMKNREILRKQLELLAKESKRCMPTEFADLSNSAAEIYEKLSNPHPFGIAIFLGVLINFSFGFFKKFINLFRGHGR